MKKHFQIIFLFLLIVISFNFFEAALFREGVAKYIQFGYILIAIIISLPYAFPKWEGFVVPVQLIFGAVTLSILMAYISWGQGFTDSLKATVPLMLWIFFFYLIKTKIPASTLEKIIIIYGGIYVLLYLYQFAESGTVLFGWQEEFSTDRGITRVILPGGGVFILAAFMALNKSTSQSHNRAFWIFFAALGIVIPVMQVTRQFIAATVFLYLVHLLRKTDIVKKTIMLVSFAVLIIVVSNINHPIVKGLKDVQKQTYAQGKEYIRVKAGTYYLIDFSPNLLSRVLGNGVPYGDKSEYGKHELKIRNEKLYYLSDIGLIAVYAMFGIIAVIGLILIWIKSFIIPLPAKYMYVKYYLWFLLITSLTSHTVYHNSFIITTIMALSIYQQNIRWDNKKEKLNELLANMPEK